MDIDIVLPAGEGSVDVVECKYNPDHFSLRPIGKFRKIYPDGHNICLCPFIDEPYIVDKNGIRVHLIGRFGDFPASGMVS